MDDSALAQASFPETEMLCVFQVPGALLTLVRLLHWVKENRWQKTAFILLE